MVLLNKLPWGCAARLQEGKLRREGDQGPARRRAIEPFKYFDKGTMATIGYRSAVADASGIKVTGFLAYSIPPIGEITTRILAAAVTSPASHSHGSVQGNILRPRCPAGRHGYRRYRSSRPGCPWC
jgi:hypothetical protein